MLNRVFFNEKPVKALASLTKTDRVWYASLLAKEIDCTYPHMMTILRTFEQNGLITSEGQGRVRIIRLTDRGDDLGHEFEGLLRRLDKVGTITEED